MFFDLVFFSLPMAAAILLGLHAKRSADKRFWRASFCLGAYLAYYLIGGREVILYLTVGTLVCQGMGHACGIAGL